MNKNQKEVQQAFLDSEKEVLDKLKKNYQDALNEINSKIELLMARQDADMSHVIYQVEYQKALKKQVQGILDTLQANEFETVSEYLAKSYEDGFIGTMYDIHGQGIPIVMPMDQEQIVQAIQHETKLKESLYEAFDIKDLQKKISSEISRGISTGMMFPEIARNISNYAGISRNKAMRIARTEGHRIQCKATSDAQWKAKSKGADIVKQWDSTLDKRTRKSHRRVDGEIRELGEKREDEEPFSNGLMFPGDPNGGASEVVNCRCALLQRAKWALDEEELETLKKRAEYFDLDKAESFADYKKKYLKAVKEDSLENISKNSTIELKDKIAEADAQIEELKKQFSDITDGYSYDDWFKDFKSIEDGYGYITEADEPNAIKLKDISQKLKTLTQKKTQWKSKLPVLGGQGTPLNIEDALKGANPNFARGTQYSVNCQRCVQAYELRRRGYTVEALPKPKKNNTIVWGNECFVDSSGNTPSFKFHLSEKDIRTTLANAPDGSRHIVYTVWANKRTAHVFIAEKENGVVKFVDPQTNSDNVESYFSLSKKKEFGILRVDDKDITSDSSKLKATVGW